MSLPIQDIAHNLQGGDRNTLARLITMAESSKADHQLMIQQVLDSTIHLTGKSMRLAITGAPGAGKSTFIESFGMHVASQNKKIAVLSVDPSSPTTKGSILGDKTRMERLSKNPNAFIRPSASHNFPGGVAQATRESILLCEAAGFEIIIIETVGVGQSEFSVKDMTDCFILLMLAGAGDELQGIKKGIMEMADIVVITKADGDNLKKTGLAQAEFQHALHLITGNNHGWVPSVITSSALEERGLKECWDLIQKFIGVMKSSGEFEKVRNSQLVSWLKDQVIVNLRKRIDQVVQDEKWSLAVDRLEKKEWTVFKAVNYLLEGPIS